ncbi:MAG: Gfo/Idh/MocA family oxidoreductase [Rhodospirillales bacterium]|nr:Gfo/Idh/MocA family oxidoreductase [Rhodospirillales bacterium]
MPGETIGWGLIGTGTVAQQWMIDAIRAESGSDVSAVFDINRERAEQVAKQWPGPRVEGSVESLLANEAVDAVYICTTNETHAPLTLQAAAAGKHVLCEKPMAMNLDDARAMIAACEKAGVVLGINHHLRHAATHRAMRRAIAEGRIGTPVAGRVFHAVFLPGFLQTWRTKDAKAGGGAILDITVHNADTIRYLFGEEPREVVAMTQTAGMGEGGIEDGVMSVVSFDSGLIVQMHEGFTVEFAGTGLEVHGTQGSLFAKDVMTQQAVGSVILRNAKGEAEIVVEPENLYARGVRYFAGAIRGKGKPQASGEDGFYSLALALAVREAAQTGKRVKIERP